jgi:hypothetical protein
MEPLDAAVDHVRGGSAGRVIVEYGDYECGDTPTSSLSTCRRSTVWCTAGPATRPGF